MATCSYHTLPDGRRIAYRLAPGAGPTLVFLPGYMSDMSGAKAAALARWSAAHGRACLLLDYSGCGASPGDFATGTLTGWGEEVVWLIEARVTGPVMLVGSSMGGWLMLLVAQALGERVTALVGIAGAPDFTKWGYSAAEQSQLAAGETVWRVMPYGPDPVPTHAAFWRDGQARRVLEGPIAYTAPVRLLHGQEDHEVPPEISLQLARALCSLDVQVTLVKGGDHRLSRPGDLAALLAVVSALCEMPNP